MALSIKCSLHEPEDLNFNLRQPYKSLTWWFVSIISVLDRQGQADH